MPRCNLCDKTFRDSYNLNRHTNRYHSMMGEGEEDVFTTTEENSEESGEESGEESTEESSEEGESDDGEEDSDDEETPTCEMYLDILDKVYERYEETKKTLIDEYKKEEGVDDEEASKRAYQRLLPKYRKAFREEYRNMLSKIRELRNDPTHKMVMETVKKLKEEEDFDKDEAVRSAISKRKHLIDRIVPSDPENSDDEL